MTEDKELDQEETIIVSHRYTGSTKSFPFISNKTTTAVLLIR